MKESIEDYNYPFCPQNLRELWGRIDAQHNQLIYEKVKGQTVLDVGCGYGSLVNYLQERGLNAEGIDNDHRPIGIGHDFFFPKANTCVKSLEEITGQYDTVILRDVLHHVKPSFNKIPELVKPKGRLVIFDPNPTLLVKLARKTVSHNDDEVPVKETLELLKQNNFHVLGLRYYETIGIALSGGYVMKKPLAPNWPIFAQANALLSNAFNALGLGPALCWRYLTWAEKVK